MPQKVAIPPDIEIAQRARLRPIRDVAAELGLDQDDLVLFGEYKTKVKLAALEKRPQRGRLVLVTGMNPTSAGEGKSTVTVGVTQALRRLGHNAVACIREPSLGPVFGLKGGAAGGGYSQVLPMEDINLHFTGDFHAITCAHNLLSAMLDNHLHRGNALLIDPRHLTWPRAIDMNDRALRHAVTGLGRLKSGPSREDRFVITPASEVMAIMALAEGLEDLEGRLARIVLGATFGNAPVTARDLKAHGAMTLLLKDALMPNLVQTIEGGPAFVHCGPFGNIAHGCNSVLATRMGMATTDIVLTEAGFGSDLGAEKFFNIKCRMSGLQPQAAILVATVRALKTHGGVKRSQLKAADPAAVERGTANLRRHIRNVKKFGVPLIVVLNRFLEDTEKEVAAVREGCSAENVSVLLCEVWEKGGQGGLEVAEALVALLDEGKADFRPLYDAALPIKQKIDVIAREIYGADGVDYTTPAEREIGDLESFGLADTPVCVAKTQYSLSDKASRLGTPSGFRLKVQHLYPSAGAGFVVAVAGDILTMPGLPKSPAAERMRVKPDGAIEGLF